jgi:putative nucleotidyltransferase with HDIG domain
MANVLLVGDERERTADVKSLLTLDGHQVANARDVSRWPEDEKTASPDVVVAAVASPDGVLSAHAGRVRGFAPPILFVHRESDDPRDPHMDTRVVDRIASPFAAEELLGRVDALVRVRRVVMHQGVLESDGAAPRGGRWAAGLASLLRGRVPRHAKPKASYLEVAARVAEWSDRRDGFEPGHAERVTNFAALIAEEFELADGETAALLRAAMLHDIGKVALPVEVLRHKGPLEENQIRLIRTHAERGAAILRALDKDEVVADTILNHHEHVDGSGYHGRTGTTIPRASRILAVAEAYDAMTTSLVRKRLTRDGALGLLRERRGGQWDGECVDALVTALKPVPSAFSLV